MSARLALSPLSAAAFTPYGDVIETADRAWFPINGGTTRRYNDLAQLHTDARGGRTGVSIFAAQPFAMPLRIASMERHPLSSQAFMPLHGKPYLVVVADTAGPPAAADLRAFIASGDQGVNYRAGIWHHPLIALEPCHFLVVDRIGPGPNCDVVDITDGPMLDSGPADAGSGR